MTLFDKEQFVDTYGKELLKTPGVFTEYNLLIDAINISEKQRKGLHKLYIAWYDGDGSYSQLDNKFNLLISLLYKTIKEIETKK